MVQKEVQSQRLLQFFSLINNPLDAQMVKRDKLLKDVAKSLDIDPEDVLKSEKELMNEQQLQQAIAASLQGGQGIEQPNGEGMVGPDARNQTAPPQGEGPIGNNGGLPL
jgi:hypothetical protein